jgi:transcriptional regulator with XRE-family HTH domain
LENSNLAQLFGEFVRIKRLMLGLTQESLGDKCGLHRTYIGSIERGEKIATIETAQKIAIALNMTLGQLFQEIENKDNG